MDYRALVNKLEAIQAGTYISEATAPTTFTPTHFHKGNLGNKLPLMQTPDGAFWWESTTQGGEAGMGGTGIVPWQGDSLNRSGWNPASVDGVIKDGKMIDFPEGVNWKQYKETADADSALMEKLKKLLELIEKYNALRAKRGQGAKPAGPVTQNMGDGSKLTTDAKGNVAAMDDEGNPYVPGSNPNLPKNKVKEGRTSIAQSLVESFGYQLDELATDSAEDIIRRRAERMAGEKPLSSYGTAGKNVQAGRASYTPPVNAAPVATTTAKTATSAAPVATTGAKTATSAGSKALGAGSKLLGRGMMGVGAVLGAQGAYDSYKKGDYLGAALNGLSGAFSLVPGLGWIPAVGLGAWQAGRELSGATDKYDNPEGNQGGQTTAPPGAGPVDSKVKALQQRILAKDPNALPKYGADGRMGPETQAAMARLKIQETTMPQKSLAETMRDLQQKLDEITDKDEVNSHVKVDSDDLEETLSDAEAEPIPPSAEETALQAQAEKIGGTIGKVDGEIFIITKDGTIVSPEGEIMDKQGSQLVGTGQDAPDPTGSMSESGDALEEGFWDGLLKGAAKLGRSSAVMGRRTARMNPVKTGLGVGAASLAGGYASGSAGADSSTSTPPKPPKPTTGGQGGQTTPPATPDTSAADDAEMAALKAQIDALIKDLSTSKNPEVQKGLAAAQEKLK